ncbi:solute carrier family 28 member 3 [Drosophila albomicans]|uniref:Solute carrier family 28 member 3 n=1 Tax=Drosophila albomicans TaxID=7291 RepID=A0A6P8X8Q4_DROAB|nr:solute carrier family 28 member 3 [Drosophila albomicans]
MAESPNPEEEDPKAAKRKKIIKLVLHVLFHIFFLSFFIWATVIYVLHDPNAKKCIRPQPEEVENTTTQIAITEGEEGVPATTLPAAAETTTEASKQDDWQAHILCEFNWCTGYGFLLLMLLVFYAFWIYYWVFKPYIGQKLYDDKIEPGIDKWIEFSRKRLVSIVMLIVLLALVGIYLGFECRDDGRKAIGLLGPVVFILLGVLVSKSRRDIPWRVVVHGILGQLILGILCIRLQVGRDIFICAGKKVTRFLSFTEHGSRFVYGDRICDEFVFAFAILAVIFFFSVVTSVLYYLGAMQFILGAFGFFLQATVGTTVCESVNAVGNVFLGMSESPLMIRPYIKKLTKSELHCICTSGYATVAGTVLGAYISFGASAAFLITASVMAAPGALAFAKLFYPETEESQTKSDNIELEKSEDRSILDAAASGAANGVIIVLGIVSNIIAFLAIVYFFNAVTEWMFELVGHDDITFLYLLTKLFIPLVFIMGVPTHDCENVALVVAEKTIINEFVGYKTLGEMIREEKIDQRSAGIATFALCGFANPGSLGILIAALSAMAPDRRHDITMVALRAFLTGSIVSFTSASIAGILIQDHELDKLSKSLLDYIDDGDGSVRTYNLFNI